MLNSSMISRSSLNSHTPTTPFIHHHLLATHNSLQKPFILLLKEWERWEERALRRKGVCLSMCVCVCAFKSEWRKENAKEKGMGSVPPTYTHCTCRTGGRPSWKMNTLILFSSLFPCPEPTLSPAGHCPNPNTHRNTFSLSLSHIHTVYKHMLM